MYEPVVLQKRKPRNFGNLVSILAMIGSVTIVSGCVINIFLCSNFIHKKKKLLAEFDERDVNVKRLTPLEEYHDTKSFWRKPSLQGAVHLALKKFKEKENLSTSVKSSSSESDIPKANN
ncbi:hypothetical protein ANTQUA_LOCUS4705 [Anthophora quadrimaculata]